MSELEISDLEELLLRNICKDAGIIGKTFGLAKQARHDLVQTYGKERGLAEYKSYLKDVLKVYGVEIE